LRRGDNADLQIALALSGNASKLMSNVFGVLQFVASILVSVISSFANRGKRDFYDD
jgi:hypothetical protein